VNIEQSSMLYLDNKNVSTGLPGKPMTD